MGVPLNILNHPFSWDFPLSNHPAMGISIWKPPNADASPQHSSLESPSHRRPTWPTWCQRTAQASWQLHLGLNEFVSMVASAHVVCIYIYIHTHIHMKRNKKVYIYEYVCIYIYIYIYKCIQKQKYRYTCIYVQTYTDERNHPEVEKICVFKTCSHGRIFREDCFKTKKTLYPRSTYNVVVNPAKSSAP